MCDTYIYIYIYIYTHLFIHAHECSRATDAELECGSSGDRSRAAGPTEYVTSVGIHYRGVQWEGAAVDWGSII